MPQTRKMEWPMWYQREMYPEYNGRQCVFYTLNACLVNNKLKKAKIERE